MFRGRKAVESRAMRIVKRRRIDKRRQFLSQLPDMVDLDERPIAECVIVEMISKKTYTLRECFQIVPEHSILFL